MTTEASIIDYLKTQFPEQIGDDAAVLSSSNNEKWVITQDVLIEDVHFRRRYQNAASLAHKALHVNLSDLAAMGATPLYVLLSISTPVDTHSYITDFLTAFSDACRKAHVILIGGDTTRAPRDQLFLSVTAIGSAPISHIKYRHTAKPYDFICIAGQLGAAHIGFTALENNHAGFEENKQCFLNPIAKSKEGLWLGQQTQVHAMMDLSDGLYTDLAKLVTASHVGATIDLDLLKPTEAFISECQQLKLDVMDTQLIGGEDYGLLFTVDAQSIADITTRFKAYVDYPLKVIGQMTQENKVRYLHHGLDYHPRLQPFSHL